MLLFLEFKGGLGVSPREEQSDGSTPGGRAEGSKRAKPLALNAVFRGFGGLPHLLKGSECEA